MEDSALQPFICTALGAALYNPNLRSTVIEWIPPAERAKEVKGKRGWEVNAGPRQGGWVYRHLVNISTNSKDPQSQTAAIAALAALVKDNQPVAATIRSEQDGMPL